MIGHKIYRISPPASPKGAATRPVNVAVITQCVISAETFATDSGGPSIVAEVHISVRLIPPPDGGSSVIVKFAKIPGDFRQRLIAEKIFLLNFYAIDRYRSGASKDIEP